MRYAIIGAGLAADEDTFRFDASRSMPPPRFGVFCFAKTGIDEKTP